MRFPVITIIILLIIHHTVLAQELYKGQKQIYHGGWIDLNKNGAKDIYEDPDQPDNKRIYKRV